MEPVAQVAQVVLAALVRLAQRAVLVVAEAVEEVAVAILLSTSHIVAHISVITPITMFTVKVAVEGEAKVLAVTAVRVAVAIAQMLMVTIHHMVELKQAVLEHLMAVLADLA